MIERISSKIIAFKWPILILLTLVTIFLGAEIRNLRIDADVLRSLPDDDPDALLMKEIGQNFGGNRMGIVILETDNIYKEEVIGHIRMLSDSIGRIEGISSVSSLTNIINIKGGENGIEIGNLVDPFNPPRTEEDFSLLKQNISGNAMYRGSIVSERRKRAKLQNIAVQQDASL